MISTGVGRPTRTTVFPTSWRCNTTRNYNTRDKMTKDFFSAKLFLSGANGAEVIVHTERQKTKQRFFLEFWILLILCSLDLTEYTAKQSIKTDISHKWLCKVDSMIFHAWVHCPKSCLCRTSLIKQPMKKSRASSEDRIFARRNV